VEQPPAVSDRPPPDDPDGQLALDVLRGLAEEESARADKVVGRARQAFAVSTGFFAIVQTVALGTFGAHHLSTAERHGVIDRAVWSGIALCVCTLVLVIADAAFRSHNIDPDEVLNAAERASDGEVSMNDELLSMYAAVVETRRGANKWRTLAATLTQVAALATIALILVELIYALEARLS
jgi:F0F1-type ATP synthase epsilon subunit